MKRIAVFVKDRRKEVHITQQELLKEPESH